MKSQNLNKRLLSRSQYKTLLLGVLAFATICYSLIWVLDVPSYDVWVLIGVSLAFIVALALIGFVVAIFVRLIKHWLN